MPITPHILHSMLVQEGKYLNDIPLRSLDNKIQRQIDSHAKKLRDWRCMYTRNGWKLTNAKLSTGVNR